MQDSVLFRVRFKQVSLCIHVREEKFEDTKGVIRSHKSKSTDNKMVKRKRTNNDLQNITQKTSEIRLKEDIE